MRVQRTVWIADRYFGDVVRESMLDGRQSQHEVTDDVANFLRDGIFEGGNGCETTGGFEHLVADAAAFGTVAIEKTLTARIASHGRQFPGKVERVLHAGVHALAASGAVHVRSV